MAIPAHFLEELKSRVGLADVIGKRVKLTRKGREHTGLCPFHKEKTPSFTVNEDKGFYHCFGCQAHGSVFDFVMETEGLEFRDAVEKLAAMAGMSVPQDSPEARERERRRRTLIDVTEAAAQHFERMLHMPEGRGALTYLKDRGLSDETVQRFRLGFAPERGDSLKSALAREGISPEQMIAAGLLIKPTEDRGRGLEPYERFRGRVMFPIADRQGRIIAFGGRALGDREPKYLNSPETPLFHKGRELYGLDLALPAARKADTIIVTEGYMDVIALSQAGLTHAVAPLGTALTEDQMRLLWRAVREPVLCFDGDAAGARAAAKAAVNALPMLKPGYGLRFASLPAGEDPDSLVAARGRTAFDDVLDRALALSEVIWRAETGGRLPTTPEAKAALQKRLDDLTRTIQDPMVRRHFSSAFQDRLWPSRPDTRSGDRRPRWSPNVHLGDDVDMDGRTDIDTRREEVLISALVNHPEIYDDVAERLGTLTFSVPTLDNLRQEVLKTLAAKSGLDFGALKNHLIRCGFSDVLAEVTSAKVYAHGYFARPEATPEEAQAGWNETFNQLRGKDLVAEIEEAERNFAENPTEETWHRLSALKGQQNDAPADELSH